MNTTGDDLNLMRLTWRRIGQLQQLEDGTWRAFFPCAVWGSVTAATKEEAEEKAVRKALDEGDDPEWVMQRIVESLNAVRDYPPDDLPKGTWVFRLHNRRRFTRPCLSAPIPTPRRGLSAHRSGGFCRHGFTIPLKRLAYCGQ